MGETDLQQKVARALSDKWDVSVTAQGAKAYTDGTNVVIPAMPDNPTYHHKMMARGYVDHETEAHVINTDWNALHRAIPPKTTDPELRRLHTIWNFIEDIKGERKGIAQYPGSKKNLNYVTNELLKDPSIDLRSPLMKLFVEGRRQLLGYEFPDVPDLTDELKAVFGPDVLEQVAKVETTQDALDLARKFKAKYQAAAEADQQEEQQKGRQKGKGQKGDQSDGEGQGGKGEPADDDADDEGKGSSGQGDEQDGDSDGAGAGGGGQDDGDEEGDGESDDQAGSDESSGTAGNERRGDFGVGDAFGNYPNRYDELADQPDPYDGVRKYLEQEHDKLLNNGTFVVFDKSADKLRPFPETDDLTVYELLRKQLGAFNAMRGRVQNMFMARTQARWLGGKYEGKVNSRALARVPAGYTDVFKKKFESKDRDTAVTFLIDFSGSMSGKKVENAMAATILLLECFEGTKIKTEVMTYTTGPMPNSARQLRNDSSGWDVLRRYGRIESLDMRLIKTFAEPLSIRHKRRISAYGRLYHSMNNTPGGCPIVIAHDRLMARPEQRKVLIVLTDGCPGTGGVDSAIERGYLKKVCTDIVKAGRVELIAFALEAAECKRYYPAIIDITKSKDLPKMIFTELRKILRV